MLNNCSPYDPLATVRRLDVGLSTLMAYPIVFIGLRDGVMGHGYIGSANYGADTRESQSVDVHPVEYIHPHSIIRVRSGSHQCCGRRTCCHGHRVCLPTLMFRMTVVRLMGTAKENMKEVVWASALTAMGVVIGLVSVWRAIAGNFSRHLK